MCTINPKFKISVYEGIEFNEEAYENNRQYAIFTVKPNNYMQNLIEKHESTLKAKKQQERLAKLSPTSPGTKTVHMNTSTSRADNTYSQDVVAESHEISPSTTKEESSKLKSKLKNDVQMAKLLSETSQKEEKQDKDQHDHMKDSNNERTRATTTAGFHSRSARLPNTIKTWGRTFRTVSGASTKMSPLQYSLYYDTRINAFPKTSHKNPVIEGLLDQEELITGNSELMASIIKLRDMKLLKTNNVNMNKYKGVGKIDYVYNDFHARHTNPGYSRNTAGAFYCR
jgi:hypothetical protein